MYCKNCGIAIIGKPALCTNCGTATNLESTSTTTTKGTVNPKQHNEVVIDPLEKLKKFNFQTFLQNKASVAAVLALLACFLTWVKINVYYVNLNLSLFNLAKLADQAPNTILSGFITYLFPLSLLGFILADYIPQIAQFKKIFSFASLILLVYFCVGLYQATHPSMPDMPKDDGLGGMMSGLVNTAKDAMKDAIKLGFGFYIALMCSVTSFVLYNFKSKFSF